MIIPRPSPWWSGTGLLYALWGALWASVRRFAVQEYRDSHEGIKRSVGPVNGLYGGLAFWGLLRPAGHGRKIAACGPWEVTQAAGSRWGV